MPKPKRTPSKLTPALRDQFKALLPPRDSEHYAEFEGVLFGELEADDKEGKVDLAKVHAALAWGQFEKRRARGLDVRREWTEEGEFLAERFLPMLRRLEMLFRQTGYADPESHPRGTVPRFVTLTTELRAALERNPDYKLFLGTWFPPGEKPRRTGAHRPEERSWKAVVRRRLQAAGKPMNMQHEYLLATGLLEYRKRP